MTSAYLGVKVSIGKNVTAWESAKIRSTKTVEAEGDAEVRQEPKAISTIDEAGMKEAYEAKYGELTGDVHPS